MIRHCESCGEGLAQLCGPCSFRSHEEGMLEGANQEWEAIVEELESLKTLGAPPGTLLDMFLSSLKERRYRGSLLR